MEWITSSWFIILMVVLAIWDLCWKLVALWKSARNGHVAWFVCLGIINTLGILPIIYILVNNKGSKG